MISVEGDLMLPYSDSSLHAGDFGNLDRVIGDLFEGVRISQLDFHSRDLFSSSINDRASYDDDKSLWNGNIGKQGAVEFEENKATTNKIHRCPWSPWKKLLLESRTLKDIHYIPKTSIGLPG
ncbi:hypothetical protein SUGI_0771560 [Cryptomeria japonica]|nr:hypothetical protein SUGI_0771560 [Cryptomeria japonica]